MKFDLLYMALEDNQPVVQIEKEICFYVKIDDFEQLKNASTRINQEQWILKIPKTDKNAAGGSIRIRKSMAGENTEAKYEQTIKVKLKDGSRLEIESESNVDAFTAMAYLSEGGMVKDRFTFGESGWELDVYLDKNGQYYNWCRLEYEFKDGESAGTLPDYPIKYVEIITSQDGQRTAEEEATVRTLFDTVFVCRNKYL